MLQNLMLNTVNVNRPTPSKGTSGAEKDTLTTVYTATPCMVQPVKTAWKIEYAQRKIEVTHSIYFNSSITVKNGDQVSFGTRTFFVEGVRDLDSMGRVLVVDCRELT